MDRKGQDRRKVGFVQHWPFLGADKQLADKPMSGCLILR
jgi:hypothetical protein